MTSKTRLTPIFEHRPARWTLAAVALALGAGAATQLINTGVTSAASGARPKLAAFVSAVGALGGGLLKTPVDIAQMTYRVQRRIKTQLHRKSTFPEGAKVSFDLSLGELFVSTRDIPKTDGWSKLTISVAANGTPLYTFSARSEQGKLPSYSDGQASGSIAARRSDYLALANFKKRLEFVAPAGRSADEIVITILSEGTGRRLPGWSAGEQPARKRKAARG